MIRYLYTFNEAGNYNTRTVECLPDRWVKVVSGQNENEKFPIEDFGDYILSQEKLDNPFEEWYKIIKESKNV